MPRDNEKTCQDANCQMKGFWQVAAPDGEKQLHTRVRHNNEWHVATVNLAETAVALIKRDKRFAEHFNKLLTQ